MMIDKLSLSTPSYSSIHIFNHPNTVITERTSTVHNNVDDDVINNKVCPVNDNDKRSAIRMALINSLKSDIRSTPTRGLLVPPPDYFENQIKTNDFFSFSAVNNHIIPDNNIASNTNKFVPNTNRFLDKNAVTVYNATLFPLCEQILPLWYNGKINFILSINEITFQN